jgi:hypothetical protein
VEFLYLFRLTLVRVFGKTLCERNGKRPEMRRDGTTFPRVCGVPPKVFRPPLATGEQVLGKLEWAARQG